MLLDRCLYPHANDEPTTTNPSGVIGMLPGVIGCLQALEVIKIITDTGNILQNKLFTINLLNLTTSIVDIIPDVEQREIALANFKKLTAVER